MICPRCLSEVLKFFGGVYYLLYSQSEAVYKLRVWPSENLGESVLNKEESKRLLLGCLQQYSAIADLGSARIGNRWLLYSGVAGVVTFVGKI